MRNHPEFYSGFGNDFMQIGREVFVQRVMVSGLRPGQCIRILRFLVLGIVFLNVSGLNNIKFSRDPLNSNFLGLSIHQRDVSTNQSMGEASREGEGDGKGMKKLDSIVNFDLMENKAGNTYTNTRKRHETFEQSNARHHNAGINALWVVIILCTVLAYKFYFHKYKITYVPESVAAMIVGIAVGTCLLLIARYSSYVLEFKLEGFYYILLPPIIFKAGFGLEKSQFFGNIGSISIFALFGTLISTLIIGFSLFGLAKLGIVPLDSNHALEALMFGALISSTDPVSTVSIMSSLNTDPMLHALIFGESVLNDAVCITLYKTLEGFHPFFSEKTELVGFEFHDLGKCIIIFLGITLVSIMIGVLFALACSMISNKCPRIQNHPEIEIGMTFFSAYGAYCVGEIAEMSGIMALFFCAIVLAHYHSHNLSKSSKTAVEGTVQALGFFAETAVFVVLGITAVSSIAPASTFQVCLFQRVLRRRENS
eukprot:1323247-Amorphochlora_amoeboformis.AAC.1